MNLSNFKKIDSIIRQTSLLALFFCVILAISYTISFIYLSNKIEELYTKALVIDTKGNVYEATSVRSSDMRLYEYENHVKTFVKYWYSFDEYTYEKNIESGLHLIGEKGKELLNEYNDLAILSTLVQKNIRYGVTINDIKIDTNTLPVKGTLLATQTGYRAKGSVERNMTISFTLYDVARSRENVHGAKIGEWNIKYTMSNEK